MMQVWGANCVASPSTETNAGRKILKEIPDTPGSLGIAISEAIEQAVTDPSGKTRYSLGSVLNHVLLHQSIIGLEAKAQLNKNDKERDTFVREFAKKLGVKERPYNFDLVISTDRYGVDEATAIILHGFELYTKLASKTKS